MASDRDSTAAGDVDLRLKYVDTTVRTLAAAAGFERAIAAAERGPSPNVHHRVHEAMIEATRSELAVLGEQLDES